MSVIALLIFIPPGMITIKRISFVRRGDTRVTPYAARNFVLIAMHDLFALGLFKTGPTKHLLPRPPRGPCRHEKGQIT